ncbi:7365_t:CDS:1, partial [Gigaspora margarita]
HLREAKHDHASSKSQIQTSKTTTEDVHEILDDSKGSYQYNDPQQETSFAGTSFQK